MATSAERMRALRARRTAELEAAPGAPLRDAATLLGPAVEETLAALELGGRDAAVAQLARRYAAAIDEAQNPVMALIKVGPLLAKALEALRATPAARGAKEAPRRQGPSRLAQLRAESARQQARHRVV
jgi:hypothetical protein